MAPVTYGLLSVVVLVILGVADAQLNCYACGVNDVGCQDPAMNNIPTISCSGSCYTDVRLDDYWGFSNGQPSYTRGCRTGCTAGLTNSFWDEVHTVCCDSDNCNAHDRPAGNYIKCNKCNGNNYDSYSNDYCPETDHLDTGNYAICSGACQKTISKYKFLGTEYVEVDRDCVSSCAETKTDFLGVKIQNYCCGGPHADPGAIDSDTCNAGVTTAVTTGVIMAAVAVVLSLLQ